MSWNSLPILTYANSGVHFCIEGRNLKRHINSVHNGQKDHKCDSCGKAFSRAGHLKRHIDSVHNGQKDHKCDSCGNAFSQAGNLKTHIDSVHHVPN